MGAATIIRLQIVMLPSPPLQQQTIVSFGPGSSASLLNSGVRPCESVNGVGRPNRNSQAPALGSGFPLLSLARHSEQESGLLRPLSKWQ